MDTALLFSGGKDSLALLHMHRELWDSMYVVWVNPGAPYPSTVKQMDGWRAVLPHFVEVKGNQPEHIAQFGYPVDVLPINYTRMAKTLYGSDSDVMVQSYLDCCSANLWGPLSTKLRELGIKRVLSAFRRDESHDNMVHGDLQADGVRYEFPLIDWSEDKVFAFLRENDIPLPEEYAIGEKKSRDCWNCTAWAWEDVERVRRLPDGMRAEVRRRYIQIADITRRASQHLENALRSANYE